MRNATTFAATLACAAVLAGCAGTPAPGTAGTAGGGGGAGAGAGGDAAGGAAGGDARIVRPGAPGEAGRVVGVDSIGPPLRHTAADVEFMKGMIAHHLQAIEMVALVQDRASRPDLRLLGQRIAASQNDEIELMEKWLRDRGEEPPGRHAHHHGDHTRMPGMLTPEQMARLAAARGPEFDRLFLAAMIIHHEGALAMVADLFNTPGAAQEEEIFTFASHVEADQRIEIARMHRMLRAGS
jgi:uncharacterized protein (DUF305 family)